MIKTSLDNTLIIDDALTSSECDILIESFSKEMLHDELETRLGYEYNQLGYDHSNTILSSSSQSAAEKLIEIYEVIKDYYHIITELLTVGSFLLNQPRIEQSPPNERVLVPCLTRQ